MALLSADGLDGSPGDGIGDELVALDIGEATRAAFAGAASRAATLLFAGTMGATQCDLFEPGTNELALAVAGNTGAKRIVMGVDTLAFMSERRLLAAAGPSAGLHAVKNEAVVRRIIAGLATPGISTLAE